MKLLIAGLGNPGPRYRNHRHNLGRRTVDRLRERQDRGGLPANLDLAGSEWPPWQEAYMNELGRPLAAHLRHNGIPPERLLIVHDELDLPIGEIRRERGRGSAGHKGVQSIIEHLGTADFWRIRMGIQVPEQAERGIPSERFVLQPFTRDEELIVEKMIEKAIEEARAWVETLAGPTSTN